MVTDKERLDQCWSSRKAMQEPGQRCSHQAHRLWHRTWGNCRCFGSDHGSIDSIGVFRLLLSWKLRHAGTVSSHLPLPSPESVSWGSSCNASWFIRWSSSSLCLPGLSMPDKSLHEIDCWLINDLAQSKRTLGVVSTRPWLVCPDADERWHGLWSKDYLRKASHQ